ncbi:amino acid-binding protein [Vulcanisaeta distributa]|uniref:Amino acid-binding ACT domain protein n=1 Tax=Vulcanisaeta distributa (strain DSM 14429 / JCM 11212 / NBRC 100878 / IC-017) TaxID=572478 RepID=E1QS40_VULDI|nr:amino acid-binding protein [Vulcanisaeta distributa]ADN51872.1 amino acid-binding ACT domain protein [Vulcanisaeta distributa DSM 14429]
MVWLLVSISRDRPGLLNDITGVIRSRNLNIRNIVGNNYAILIEVDGEVNNELLNNVSNVDGVNTVNMVNLPFTILGFIQENFMRALVFYVMEREPELIERLGYEYGKELMRYILNSMRDFRDALYSSLRILTALGVIALVNVQFMPNKTVISIAKSFDEDIGMPMTKGIIRGLFEAVDNIKRRISVSKVNQGTYNFIIT